MNINDVGSGTIRVDMPLAGGKTATFYFTEQEQLDFLQWQLARLGVDITAHSRGPDYGWFYAWRNAATDWEGPCESRKAAIEEAFARAVRAIVAHRTAPFPLNVGDIFVWTGNDWEQKEAARELGDVLQCARNQAQHDTPYCTVGECRPYQYHFDSGRWYVEVSLDHRNAADEGSASGLYRVWRIDDALTARRVDIR